MKQEKLKKTQAPSKKSQTAKKKVSPQDKLVLRKQSSKGWRGATQSGIDEKVVKEIVDGILKVFITEHDSRNYMSLGGNLDIFRRHLEGTYLSIVSTLKPTIESKKEKERELLKFILDKCQLDATAKSASINVPIEYFSEFRQIEKDYNQFYTACAIIPRSTVVTLVSYFDHLLGRIVQCLYRTKPELINLADKQITLAELYKFGSLDAAKDYFLEKEIESLLRKSHTEQFEWLEHKFDVKLRCNKKDWSSFIELTERRNLYVHTNGRVSSQYLQICAKNKVANMAGLKCGDYLPADLAYFEQAYALIYKIGVQLTHVLWRKILPDQKKEADVSYLDITYDLLSEEKYSLAIELFDFLFDTPPMRKFCDDYTRRVHVINRAQAYKWSGNNTRCQQLLDNEDWSSTSNRFNLAINVLKDEFDQAVIFMEQIGGNDEVLTKDAYLEWPLFKRFRQTAEFSKTLNKIFGTSNYNLNESKITRQLEKEC